MSFTKARVPTQAREEFEKYLLQHTNGMRILLRPHKEQIPLLSLVGCGATDRCMRRISPCHLNWSFLIYMSTRYVLDMYIYANLGRHVLPPCNQ
jgi:hypothetical protein